MTSTLRDSTIRKISLKNRVTRLRREKFLAAYNEKEKSTTAKTSNVQVEVWSINHEPKPVPARYFTPDISAEDLTLERAIAMQEELIAGFSDNEFQTKLADLGRDYPK